MSLCELRRGSAGEEAIIRDVALRERDSRPASRRHLLCRSCGSVVTSHAERISIEGSHVHRRTNPAGLEFEIGCFLAASGAATVGEPTTEFSWFGGYAWSYSMCRACGAHLGWHFEGQEPPFHGLILDRLKGEDQRE